MIGPLKANGNDEIRVVIYGCRGSIPVNGADFDQFGGSTTCILITSDDAVNIGIIDAGTGIRNLGRKIMKDETLREKPIFIAFTHFHWDHIQGLPFFEPAYVKGKKISLLALGRERPIDDLERVFSVPMQREYFPVQLSDMGANFEFVLPDENIRLFPTTVVTAHKHQHPGSAYSYRFVRGEKSIVVCTDIEHGANLDPAIWLLRGRTSCSTRNTPQGASQPPRLGPFQLAGHRVRPACRSQKLVLTHHDPNHNDAFLGKVEERCQELLPNCVLARENMTVVV